jgi:predicted membrane-bound dolichyl-phosphate-mannose-protein mannosyltransferase
MLDIFMLAFGLAGAYFLLRRNYAWAGVLFGLGMASKWPAALMLLAVVAFMWLRKRITVKDVGWMVLFAGLAYLLVYTPLIILQGPARFLDTQFYNLGHMPAVPAASPQSSTALQWLYFQKPVWFTWNKPDFAPPSDMLWLVSVLGGTPGLAIVAFGNPVFWIPGLLSLVWLALNKAKKLSQVRLFSVIWLAFNYLPYVLIPRTHMFFYYMLPVLPAYALALSQFLAVKKWERWYLIVLAASILFFLPLLIGLPAPKDYYELLRPLIGAPP